MRLGRFPAIVKVLRPLNVLFVRKGDVFRSPTFFAADTFLIHCEHTEKMAE